MNKKIPVWHEDMQEAIIKVGMTYCLNAKDLVPFLTATLCGQFAVAGYSEDFIRKTLDHMFESYLEVKNRLDKESHDTHE